MQQVDNLTGIVQIDFVQQMEKILRRNVICHMRFRYIDEQNEVLQVNKYITKSSKYSDL